MHRGGAILLLLFSALAAAGGWRPVGSATFTSVLPDAPGSTQATVAAFEMQRTPVTNGEFAAFVKAHPEWKRGAAPALFVDDGYLARWPKPGAPGADAARQPVTGVSWFAATAYCEAQGARLPTWHEWEWAAAADASRADARDDPQWRQRILGWYSRPGGTALAPVGQSPANVHGIHDLHGLVWEWVQDFASMMVSGDNREAGDTDVLKFCGTGALTMEQKENYAVMMRVAMLSSLEARYTTGELGFRCVRDVPGLRR